MALNIKPLGDRVLVEPVEEKEVKKGGIIIPDTAKEKPMESVVVALGTGFAFFNEAFFWGLAQALARDHHAVQALLLTRVSAGLGVHVWGLLAGGMWRSAVRHWTDALVAGATLTIIAGALVLELSAGCMLTANIILGLWLARGWGKQKFARNKSGTV